MKAAVSCRPGRIACIRRWSSSLSIRLKVWRRSITAAEPSPRAACSREIRWRSTSTCFCTEVEIAEFLGKRILHRRQRLHGRAHQIERGGALVAFRPAGERMAAEVARQADARGQHGAMLPLPAGHPVGGVFDEGGETHHGSGSWKSRKLEEKDHTLTSFEVADFVADAGGLLVAFGGDGLIEARAEFFEALVEDLHGHQPGGTLPMCEVPLCMPRTIWPTSSAKVA